MEFSSSCNEFNIIAGSQVDTTSNPTQFTFKFNREEQSSLEKPLSLRAIYHIQPMFPEASQQFLESFQVSQCSKQGMLISKADDVIVLRHPRKNCGHDAPRIGFCRSYRGNCKCWDISFIVERYGKRRERGGSESLPLRFMLLADRRHLLVQRSRS